MKDWRSLFQKRILERGRDYFYEDAVRELHKTRDGYEAEVEGSEDYVVEIIMQDESIREMYCDCPYAESGLNCKHMAAVLYAIEELQGCMENDLTVSCLDSTDQLSQIIAEADEKELRAFIIKQAENDRILRQKILLHFTDTIDHSIMDRLHAEAEQIKEEFEDRSGYISYEDAWDFEERLSDFLYENISLLIGKNENMLAFELVNQVVDLLATVEIDDSDGIMTSLANQCYEKWTEILERCSPQEEQTMFSWFAKRSSSIQSDEWMAELIETFMMNEFHSRKQLQEKMKMLDDRIRDYQKCTKNEDLYFARYACERDIIMRISCMHELNCSDEEIRVYRRRFMTYPGIRELEINDLIGQRKYDDAIDMLCEWKKVYHEQGYLSVLYSKKLIELYEMLKDEKACKEELLSYLFEYGQADIDSFRKLKTLCQKKEWEALLKQLLEDRRFRSVHYELLNDEKMYEQMLLRLEHEQNISILDRYEKILFPLYPDKLMDLYVSYLQKEAACSGSRAKYKNLLCYLNKLRKYPGGDEMISQIADDWRHRYKRRRVMMQEMHIAGF